MTVPASVVAVAAAVLPLLVLGGVDLAQAARVTGVVVVQLVTGALVWLLARGPVRSGVVEVLGMGLALGSLMSLLGTQALLPFGWGSWGWLLPTALAVLSLVLPAARRRVAAADVARPTVDDVFGVLGGVAVGLVFVWSFWRAHPLDWTGWWSYYLDIPHHEALATSLATWGPQDSNLLAGDPIRYHWFAHGWAGAVTQASSAEPFVVITRALPLVAIIGTVCLAWAWAGRLSESRFAPLLAVVVTMVGANVAVQRNLNFDQLFTLSPSLGLGALWFLGAALVFTEFLSRRIVGGSVLLVLLTVGCMGGKTSYAAVLGGGVGLAALAALWRPSLRARAWLALLLVATALAGSFALLILGSTGQLRFEVGATAPVFGLLPDDTQSGLVIGTVAVVLVFAAKWAGVLALLADRRTRGRPEGWFALGVAGTGLLLLTVLAHPGASQLYFPISAGLVVGVVSGVGVAEVLERVPREWITAAVVVGVAAGGVGLSRLVGEAVWWAPYLVWGLPLTIALGVWVGGLVRRRRRRRRDRRRAAPLLVAAAVLGWGLVSAAVVTGQVTIVDTLRVPPPEAPEAGAPRAWTDAHREALVWLRENSDQDDVVVTNRQCSGAQLGEIPCAQQRWFLTAALGQRRMYVEGADYASGQRHPELAEERVERSRRFVDDPTPADAEVLWDAGARWVVVDLASTPRRDWAPYAEEAFATDTTVVLRLLAP